MSDAGRGVPSDYYGGRLRVDRALALKSARPRMKGNDHILLVEDSPDDVRLLRGMVDDAAPGCFTITDLGQLSAALVHLREQRVDALLLDFGLPDSEGIATLQRVLSEAAAIPVIVVTGQEDEALAGRAVEAGAQDCLIKGRVDGQTLVRSIRYAIRRHARFRELAQTASKLEEKNRELDAFTFSVSHDLKEPLRTVEAFSQFVLEDHGDKLDEQGRDYLRRMGAASARLKQMIEDILLLSRAGERPEELFRVDVQEVLDSIVLAMEVSIAEKRALVAIEGPLPALRGERWRLEQIFGNLISNGLKFNESARPFVAIGLDEATNGMARFHVRDNGIGIDPRFQDRVFELFQRLHRREAYEGTGAGLAIIKRAVESFGGEITLRSEPGEGSTFYVSLPLWPEQDAAQPSRGRAPEGGTAREAA